MGLFSLDKIQFNDGCQLTLDDLTVIVGPNNGGKSRALKDIKALLTEQNPKPLVVARADVSLPQDLDAFLTRYEISPHKEGGNYYLRTLASTLTSAHNMHVGPDWKTTSQRILKQNAVKEFSAWYGNFLVSLFETEDRLRIVKETESNDARNPATNLLQTLYKEGPAAEEALRAAIKASFGIDVRLDFASLRKLLFRIGDDLSLVPTDPRDALDYYESKRTLDEQGDGLRSFVATVLVLLVGKKPVILLDEPEAFLHPPQAFRLGELIASHASSHRKIILSTHSTDLMRGILSKRPSLNLVRLERTASGNSSRILDSAALIAINSSPLLSSTRVLDGLFYRGAVVVEADADVAFYGRVSSQLGEVDGIHFVHAHNKQTVAKVLDPYRKLGVKHAAIVDFDMLRVPAEFSALLNALQLPSQDITNALALRKKIADEIEQIPASARLASLRLELTGLQVQLQDFVNSGQHDNALLEMGRKLKVIREETSPWEKVKHGGFAALSPINQAVFHQLDTLCASHGLFLVPVGELESWLVTQGIPRASNKNKWIVNALERLPALTLDAAQPPWNFLGRIHAHILK